MGYSVGWGERRAHALSCPDHGSDALAASVRCHGVAEATHGSALRLTNVCGKSGVAAHLMLDGNAPPNFILAGYFIARWRTHNFVLSHLICRQFLEDCYPSILQRISTENPTLFESPPLMGQPGALDRSSGKRARLSSATMGFE